jgi:ABC-type amino acid transport substrate-binding protein
MTIDSIDNTQKMRQAKMPTCFFYVVVLLFATSFFYSSLSFSKDTTAPKIVVLMSEQLDINNQKMPLNKTMKGLFELFQKELRTPIEIRHYPWARVLQNGEAGEGLIFGIAKTPERIEKFYFSEVVFYQTIWLVTRCDQVFKFEKIDDLKNKSISMRLNSSVSPEFDAGKNKLFKVENDTSTLPARFKKIIQNRTNAMIYYSFADNANQVKTEINTLFFTPPDPHSTEEDVCVLPKELAKQANYFALSKKMSPVVLDKINQLIIKTKQKGEIDRIINSQ